MTNVFTSGDVGGNWWEELDIARNSLEELLERHNKLVKEYNKKLGVNEDLINNIKNDYNETITEVNNNYKKALKLSATNSNLEIVDARLGKANLGILTKELTDTLAEISYLHDFPRLPGETTDSPRIQRAINYVKTTTTGLTIEAISGAVPSKKQISLPPGRLIISETVKIPSYVQLVGTGRHTTILESTINDGSPILLVDGNEATSTHSFYNTIKGFSIDGKSLNSQGIKFNYAHRWTLEDVFIGGTKKGGLVLWESYIGDVISCYIFGCGDVGFPSVKLDGPSFDFGCHAVNFIGGEIVGSVDVGLYVRYGASVSIFGTTIEGNTKAGVVLDTTISTTIIGSYMEQNTNHIELLNASNPIINGNYLANLKTGSKGAIGIGKIYGGVISGNTISQTLETGQFDIYAIGNDVDLRIRSSKVCDNYCNTMPLTIQDNLLTLARTSGSTVLLADLNKTVINGKQVFADDLTAKGSITSEGDIAAKSYKLETVDILTGSGTPLGTLSANLGSLYLKDNGSTPLYGKVGGGTSGWRAVQLAIGGDTASRPTDIQLGYMYYDQTINKPVWWNGTVWKDSTGVIV